MKNYKLAWRNLWRNRRRTFITAASVFFAVFFALFMRSVQLGSYDYMYKNVIESYSGYIQVQQEEWWDEKTINNSFEYSEKINQWLLEDKNVEQTIPRIESFALASGGVSTKGVMVMGIDPEKESLLSNISDKVVKYQLSPDAIKKIKQDESLPKKTKEVVSLFEGSCYNNEERFLLDLGLKPEESKKYMPKLSAYTKINHEQINPGEAGAWIGDKLASYLELNPGDTIVLLGQGYHGTTAAGKYVIKGLVKLPTSEISGRIVYLPYDIAQQLYNVGNNVTSLVLHLNDN